MNKTEKIIFQGGEGSYEEKKSRFLATAAPVKTEEEAAALLEREKKRFWDARHHCYAFVIGDAPVSSRAADDGEPGGTAGKPILDVLEGAGLQDAMIIVTRYFGGTLLGTGGLIRSYREAAKAALEASVILPVCHGRKTEIIFPYAAEGRIRRILQDTGGYLLSTDYADEVKFAILVDEQERGRTEQALAETTGGKIVLSSGISCAYVVHAGRPILL